MSRTQEVSQTVSPITEHYFLNMIEGKLSMMKDGTEEFQPVSLPFHFILLDANAFKIQGKKMVGKMERRIKSTTGHTKQKPSVEVFYADTREVIAEGTWKEIRDKVSLEGGRYNAVIFGMKPTGEMIALNLKGKAYAAWLKFTEAAKGQDPAVYFAQNYFSIKGMESTKSSMGSNTYVPVFELGNISKKETMDMADQGDILLQKYFRELFAQKQVIHQEPVKEEVVEAIPPTLIVDEIAESKDFLEDLPF